MSGLKVLVSGIGIAGPVAAYFLQKAGATVTMVERAPFLRPGGQSIDVRGHGLRVMELMGIRGEIDKQITHEAGLRFIDSDGKSHAEFPVDDGKAFTAEVEVIRGELAIILHNAVKDKCECIFGDKIIGLDDREKDGIVVEFANGTPTRTFDIVIAADGIQSSTRKLAFGGDQEGWKTRFDQWGAWFSVPRIETDDMWANWYNAPGRRLILSRPDVKNNLQRVSAWCIDGGGIKKALDEGGFEKAREYFIKNFEKSGWQGERFAEGMRSEDDFYIQEVAQMKMPTYCKGRVVLIGDAGMCPAPVSGMGTTVGIVSAYVLAGELAKNPSDYSSAFEKFEAKVRPFVTKAQKLLPGTPWLINPETWWGIKILHAITGLVSWTRVYKLADGQGPPAEAVGLSDYTF